MQEVKVGDVVHVKARVHRIGALGCPVLELPGSMDSESRLHIDPAAIVHVETRPLQVGDVVTWGGKELKGRILAIDDGRAWVKIESGGRCQIGERIVCTLASLERV